MKKNNKLSSLILVGILALGTIHSLHANDLPTAMRFRYVGSSILSLPTGFCNTQVGYVNDDGHSIGFYSQRLGEGLEVSLARPLNKENKGRNILNGKLALSTEGRITPSISIGIVDVNKELGPRIVYAAASKKFEDIGLTISAGLYRDPVENKKVYFYGVEKIILPLFSIAGERVKDINTYGIKIFPYPGVSLNIAQRDGKEEIFNLMYNQSY